MNPRDTKLAVLADVNLRRVIRRSTTFGTPYEAGALSEQDDVTPHRLYCLFISAKAMATMEFLQQEWINSGNFMNLDIESRIQLARMADQATPR
jgi:deferrochelatase/peroxidase EfeB